MIDIFQTQRTFMESCGQEFNEETSRLYKRLIDEEYAEFDEAFHADDPQAEFKELCDLLVVIAGYAAAKGYPINEGMAEVYRSNFSKIDPETMKPYAVREDGKVLKGPHYSPADLNKVLTKNE